MGKQNRQRRRAKAQRRAAGGPSERRWAHRGASAGRGGQQPGCGGAPGGSLDAGAVEMAILAAAAAFGDGAGPGYEQRLRALGLDDAAAEPAAVAPVAQVLDVLIDDVIGDVWRHGWQPADVERVVRRRLGAGHAAAAASAITGEHRRYAAATVAPRWRAQLRAIGADPWGPDSSPGAVASADPGGVGDAKDPAGIRRRMEVLSVLLSLPPLPRLGPLPGEATASGPPPAGGEVDDRVLERVRALLAKAESTTFAEEAEAFTGKAQQLMARHALDRAMVEGTAGSGGPGGRRIGTDDPYAQAKALLLDEVATANRCRTVWSGSLGFSTVFGHEAELEGVELLYTSLLVQATRAVASAGSQVDLWGRSSTRSFRKSFYVAYATRIGQRLRDSTAAAREEGTAAHGAALVPVLAARDRAVDEAFEAAYPATEARSLSVTNGAGWRAGTTAADQARLNPAPEIERPRASA